MSLWTSEKYEVEVVDFILQTREKMVCFFLQISIFAKTTLLDVDVEVLSFDILL